MKIKPTAILFFLLISACFSFFCIAQQEQDKEINKPQISCAKTYSTHEPIEFTILLPTDTTQTYYVLEAHDHHKAVIMQQQNGKWKPIRKLQYCQSCNGKPFPCPPPAPPRWQPLTHNQLVFEWNQTEQYCQDKKTHTQNLPEGKYKIILALTTNPQEAGNMPFNTDGSLPTDRDQYIQYISRTFCIKNKDPEK